MKLLQNSVLSVFALHYQLKGEGDSSGQHRRADLFEAFVAAVHDAPGGKATCINWLRQIFAPDIFPDLHDRIKRFRATCAWPLVP